MVQTACTPFLFQRFKESNEFAHKLHYDDKHVLLYICTLHLKFCTLVTLNGKKVRCFMNEKFVLYFLQDITFEKLLSVQLTLIADF